MSKKHTRESFEERIKIINPHLVLKSDFESVNDRLKFECKYCNSELFYMGYTVNSNKMDCPKCNYRRKMIKGNILSDYSCMNNIDILDNYVDATTPIMVRHKKCNHICFQSPNNLRNGAKCPICNGKQVVIGENDLSTTNPEIVEYLSDKMDAYCYTKHSNQKIMFKCPNCGMEREQIINDVSKRGFSCPFCSDGISYPNKFSRALLKQLPIKNLSFEYSPEWLKPFRYDNYFEYDNKKYVVEMDGGIGHGNIMFGKNNICKDIVGKQRDIIKDNLAIQNNITVIRIDCLKSNPEYIKKSIYNSYLSIIFDLTNIDWNKCEEFANKSLLLDVCNYYNTLTNYEDKKCVSIGKVFNLSITTIQRYLSTGTRLGMCNYKPLKCNTVDVFDEKTMEIVGTFNSISNCARELSLKFNTEYKSANINYHINVSNKPYKGFIFRKR